MKETTSGDFTFLDFGESKRMRLKANEIRVHYKLGQKLISLNQKIAKDCANFETVHLRVRLDNITGDIHFIFNGDGEGCKVTKRAEQNSFQCSNAELVQWLAEKFGIEEGSSITLHISRNLANTPDYATYLITL